MATTTAAFKLYSKDLVSQGVDVDLSTTLYTAGTSTGISAFTGTIVTTLPSSGSPATLKIGDKTLYTDDKSAKVYIYNAEPISGPDDYAEITLDSVVLGRLYPGDWCLIPWATLVDVNITPKASTEVKIEYCILGNA